MAKAKLEIGDLVRPTFGSCFSHGNRFAVVVCTSPFVMVSRDGDMLWQKTSIKEVEACGRAGPDMLKVALRRFHRDQDYGMCPKPRKRREVERG